MDNIKNITMFKDSWKNVDFGVNIKYVFEYIYLNENSETF